MILNFRKRELRIEIKERQIEEAKIQLHEMIDNDRKNIKKINKVLSNGITLKIAKATGHK